MSPLPSWLITHSIPPEGAPLPMYPRDPTVTGRQPSHLGGTVSPFQLPGRSSRVPAGLGTGRR